jgi:hypothetical protein
MRRFSLCLTIYFSIALLASCSAIGLTDDLQIQTCSDQLAGFCEDLNELQPTNDECLRWSCDRTTGYCAILPTNMDEDEYPSEACVESGGEPEECDTDANINPGVAETCDGVDNNCNGVVDEGAFAVDSELLGAAEFGANVAEVSYALDAEGRVLVVGEAAASGSAKNVPTAALFPASLDAAEATKLTITLLGEEQDVTSSAIAAAAMAEGFVAAFSIFSGSCERIVVDELIETEMDSICH